jgi:hypothetical protein
LVARLLEALDDCGFGCHFAVWQAPALYQLTREPGAVRERTLEITFLKPGARAYAFTFG